MHISIIFAAVAVFLPGTALGLWPIPRSLTTGTTFLKLSDTFTVTVSIVNPPQDLLDAVERTKSYLKTDKLQRLVVGRGSSDNATLQAAKTLSSLTISILHGPIRPIATEAVLPIGTRDEAYTLQLHGDGQAAVLTANSTLGLFRGLTTFEQFWYDLGGVTYTNVAPISIVNDHPAYVSPHVLLRIMA